MLPVFFAFRYDVSMDQVTCVRANVVSLGGGVILSVAILLTTAAGATYFFSDVTNLQRVILFLFAIGSWIYFIDCISERLTYINNVLEFSSLCSRTARVSLESVQSVFLIHQGFNLERGMESLEICCEGKESKRIDLGPCWQRNILESFLLTIERT